MKDDTNNKLMFQMLSFEVQAVYIQKKNTVGFMYHAYRLSEKRSSRKLYSSLSSPFMSTRSSESSDNQNIGSDMPKV